MPPAEHPRSEVDLTRLVIEAAHDAFVSMDVDGCITEWNPAAEHMFGWSRQEVLGRPVADVVMPERFREAHWNGLQRFLKTGEGPVLGRRIELAALHRDGEEFPIDITISHLNVDGVDSFHAFVQNITERRMAEQELRAANELKDNLVAMVSHELRTPLTSISGFSSTMLRRWDAISDDDKRTYLSVIDSQADRLSRLVNDLLTVSRMESGHLTTVRERVGVLEVVEETLGEVAELHDVRVSCSATIAVMGDRDHLKQIIVNYVGNALKYGVPPIVLDVRAEGPSVRIAVADHGAGVPEEFVPQLWEKFTQASGHEKSGTGLGLSIVRGLAEAQRGEAWFEPVVPHGARFCVRLPRAAADDDCC